MNIADIIGYVYVAESTILRTENKDKEIVNAIQGFYNNGERSINVFSEKNHICFKKFRNLPEGQHLRIRLHYSYPLITVQVLDIYTQQFEFCFSFEAPEVGQYNGYWLLSGASGVQYPDHIFVKSIKLYDPKSPATNQHFQEARHAKAQFESIQAKIKEGVKDIFEHQSEKDVHGTGRNKSELYHLLPQ